MSLFDIIRKRTTPENDRELLGKAWLMVIGHHDHNEGLAIMKSLDEKGFIEATIALAMFSDTDRQGLIKKAAEQSHPEGLWEYTGYIPHSHIPKSNNTNDALWVKYCLQAAEAGSVDAMNEMGNIFNRLENYAESMYWYAMAFANDFKNADRSVFGIAKKWKENGRPYEYVKGSPNFDKSRFKCAIAYLEMYSGTQMTINPAEIVAMAIDNVPIAAYLAAYIFESMENYEMAYKMYNAISFNHDAHGLRCLADMVHEGIGTEKDVQAAMNIYEQAAELGERAAMFIMGEINRKSNKNLAAYWYGVSHSRGYEHSLYRLQQLSK